MKTSDIVLLRLIHNCTLLSEHMVKCDEEEQCSSRDFLRASVSDMFMRWLMLHGISEQTIRRAPENEAHARIIEDLLEAIDALVTGDRDLAVVVSELRSKTTVAADQIRATATALRN